MSQGINSIRGLERPALPPATSSPIGSVDSAETSTFRTLLMSSLNEVSGLQNSADAAVEASLAGEDITQVEVFTAMKKADLALRMLVQVRNKTVEAFNEIKQLRM